MKTVLVLSLLLITMMSCGGSQPASGVGGVSASACVFAPGLSCNNGIYAVLEPGMCASANTTNPSDCPKPYNFCDTNNRCQVQPAQAGSQQIWFATDAIRPGVTVLNSGNDYIYNIMAKGYASLDDWCMSQAQQSTLPAMRNIGSWTALIIAQPDNLLNALLPKGAARYNLLLSSAISATNNLSPNEKQTYTPSNNMFYDKNSLPVSSVFWVGMNRNFCQAMVQSTTYDCGNDDGKYCAPDSCQCFSAYPNKTCNCNDFGLNCTEYVNSVKPAANNIILGPIPVMSSNSWGDSSGQPAGVMIKTPAGCNGGIDFATDCHNGTTYNANSSSQHSILCLANQS